MRWTRHLDGPVRLTDQIVAVAAGSDGSVGVTERSRGIGSDFDYLTAKYDTAGNLLWSDRYNGPVNEIDEAVGVDVDGAGNVFVTGVFVVEYDAIGRFFWMRSLGFERPDGAADIATDSAGNVYLAGSWENYIDNDAFVVSFSPAGDERWRDVYDEPDDWDQQDAIGVRVGGDGVVYAGISSQMPGPTGYDFVPARYDADGRLLGRDAYDAGNTSDVMLAFDLDSKDNAILGGFSYFPLTASDFTTMKVGSGGRALPPPGDRRCPVHPEARCSGSGEPIHDAC
jgi:hypothetical protein